MRLRMIGLLAILMAMGTAGCATKIFGASQVGGAENATWVFIDTDSNAKANGVYRCRDDGGVVTCQKARISQ